MTEDFEDPRKAELRRRAAAAADAAGYAVDAGRPVIPYPSGMKLQGGLRPDVLAISADDVQTLLYVRVDGDKPVPQWLANHVAAAIGLKRTELYVVTEAPGDQLRATCVALGAGLLTLRADDTFDKELDFAPPDESVARKAFQRRLAAVRTRLDTKLRLNQASLENAFEESSAVTATMKASKRDKYLSTIEDGLVAWRTWAEELSERLDALAATLDDAALDRIESEIVAGPPAVA